MRETPYVRRVLEAERRYLPRSDRARYDAGLRTIRAKAHASLLPADGEQGGALDHRAWGAFVLGPILTTFAEWVVEDCRRNAQDTVFCLMREGHLLAPLIEEAARAAGVSLNVKKLWASRYAIRGASFQSASERELRAYLAKRRALSIGTVARDLGLGLDLLREESGVAGEAPLGPRELEQVVAAVTRAPELRRQVLAAAAEKRARLFRYFDAMGVFASDRSTVVDVGWNGTIQAMLADLVQRDHPRHVRGLYLATNPKLLDLPVDRCSADSFLFHLGRPRETCDILRRTPEILEHACMPALGSFRGIDARGEPETFAQPIAARQLAQIAELQAGVRHFASLWLPGAAARRRGLTHDDWSAVLDRLRAILARSLQNPTLEEARLFAEWRHDDNDGSLETEPLVGDDELRHRARFMTWDQIMRLSALECFWPQGLARLVGKGEEDSSRIVAAALRLPALRRGARLLSRSAAALARLLGR
ncbi:MAG: hypothetical protein HYV09_15940 [Deltaproteobacteria bacterium]|nr:hypothetical protein [Deltaproteobacteria bacterium]